MQLVPGIEYIIPQMANTAAMRVANNHVIRIAEDVPIERAQEIALCQILKNTAWNLMKDGVKRVCIPLITFNLVVLAISQKDYLLSNLIKLNSALSFTCLVYGLYQLNQTFKSSLQNMDSIRERYSGRSGLLTFCSNAATNNILSC